MENIIHCGICFEETDFDFNIYDGNFCCGWCLQTLLDNKIIIFDFMVNGISYWQDKVILDNKFNWNEEGF